VKKILITGGAGYIGSVLTRKLLTLGYPVTVIDTFMFTDMGLKDLRHHPHLNIVKADIRDSRSLRESLAGAEFVIHLAAIANDPSSELDLQLTREVNLESYPVLLDQAVKAGVRRFVNISSIAVYGINFTGHLTEEDSINPLTEYAACKAKSEEVVKQYNGQLTTVSLRCGTVCGWSPRMRFDLSANTLTAYAIVNGKLSVWGGDQTRPQIHIQDVTDFIAGLLTVSDEKIAGQVFNAAGYNLTVRETAAIIKEEMHGALELTSAPARSDERSYHVSSEKIVRQLGFNMKKTVRDGVADIIRAHDQGLWKDPDDRLYHNIQVMQAMGCAVL
jgi:nucleoside-diphosphate-sugar epimerase